LITERFAVFSSNKQVNPDP